MALGLRKKKPSGGVSGTFSGAPTDSDFNSFAGKVGGSFGSNQTRASIAAKKKRR